MEFNRLYRLRCMFVLWRRATIHYIGVLKPQKKKKIASAFDTSYIGALLAKLPLFGIEDYFP